MDANVSMDDLYLIPYHVRANVHRIIQDREIERDRAVHCLDTIIKEGERNH